MKPFFEGGSTKSKGGFIWGKTKSWQTKNDYNSKKLDILQMVGGQVSKNYVFGESRFITMLRKRECFGFGIFDGNSDKIMSILCAAQFLTHV